MPAPRVTRPGRARPLAVLAVATLAVTVAPAVSGAQEPTPRAPRDTAARRDSAGAVLAPIQVRASIVPTAGPRIGSGVPARVSVIDASAIEAWEPRLLADALGSQPGVSLYDDLGSPWKLNLATRGFTVGPTVGLPPGVTVFLDGVRQNEPDAQEVNFDLLPMEQVTRVELLSGSASLLGPNSLGGAINLVTARGSGPPGGEVELSGGSFGQRAAEGTVSGRTDGGTDYRVGGGYEREHGWREATGARNYNGFANVGRLGAERGLSLQAYGSRSRAETAGSLPEPLFDASPRTNFTRGDFEDVHAAQLALSGYAPLGTGRGAFTAYARASGAERFNVNQAPDPNVRSRTANATFGVTADWRRSLGLGAGSLALRVGTDAAANRVRARIYSEPTAAGGADVASGLTTDVRSPSLDVAGYALADYAIGAVTLSSGARYDFVRVPFRNAVRESDNTTSDFRNFSPRLGASVRVARGASLYASVGRSFRAPAILELGCAAATASCPLPFALGDDPPLAPVRATTYETGGQWAWRTLVATASLYRTDVRDEIFFVASDVAALSGYFTNLDRTRRAGVELAVQGVTGPLGWYGSWAGTRATFQSAAALYSIRADDAYADSPLAGENDVVPGRRLPLVPDAQAKGGALLRVAGGVSLGIDARRTGRQWLRGDEANATRPLSGYTVLNARIGLARRGWDVAAIVANVLDTHAATFGTFNVDRQSRTLQRFLTPLTGRSLRLVVRRAIGHRDADDAP